MSMPETEEANGGGNGLDDTGRQPSPEQDEGDTELHESDVEQRLMEFRNMPDSSLQQVSDSEAEERLNKIDPSKMVRLFVTSIAIATEKASSITGIPELALTEEDKDQLTTALEPLGADILRLIAILPYLPLAIFAVGYTVRVAYGIRNKSKKKGEARETRTELGGHTITIRREGEPERAVQLVQTGNQGTQATQATQASQNNTGNPVLGGYRITEEEFRKLMEKQAQNQGQAQVQGQDTQKV